MKYFSIIEGRKNQNNPSLSYYRTIKKEEQKEQSCQDKNDSISDTSNKLTPIKPLETSDNI